MIRTVEISKIYRTGEIACKALDKVTLDIQKGEFVAIMGPSGSGKTTLLNLLGLLDYPSRGEIFFSNFNVTRFKEKSRQQLRKLNMGFVFQSFNLLDGLTIFENIALPLEYSNIPKIFRKNRVIDLLEKMCVARLKNCYPCQLSGGEKQKVAIARALVSNPKLILADQPTGNLDSLSGLEIMNTFDDLNHRGTTIIIATHSASIAERCHRVINLFDGHIVAENIRKAV